MFEKEEIRNKSKRIPYSWGLKVAYNCRLFKLIYIEYS